MYWVLTLWLTVNPAQGIVAGFYTDETTCKQVALTNFPIPGPYSVILKYACVPTRVMP